MRSLHLHLSHDAAANARQDALAALSRAALLALLSEEFDCNAGMRFGNLNRRQLAARLLQSQEARNA